MTDTTEGRECANCKAPLPSDYAADNRYCAKCTAHWQGGQAMELSTSASAGEVIVDARCANCQAALPAEHPAENAYCAACSARYWAGRAASERRRAPGA